MSDTPETDAAADWYLAAAYSTDPEDRTVPLAVSRKLERERDEAIRHLENHTASTIHSCHDQCQRPMCVLRRERDEARHEIKGWRNKWECAVEMAARAEVERDEARAKP
jgi:deoxyribodipyrimidine photolyase